MQNNLYAIVLAAGKGKRLVGEGGEIPKVMHLAKGRPLLSYVLENTNFIPQPNTVIVVGYQKEAVINGTEGDYVFVEQKQQLGTGHAVKSAREFFEDKKDADVLVCYGDMPLFTKQTFQGIVDTHRKTGADCTVLTAVTDSHLDYGRVIRKDGAFCCVVEQKDCTPEQLLCKEVNVGIYVFRAGMLFESLDKLQNNNAQGEYYLTDVPGLLLKDGKKIETYTTYNENEILGVNTKEDLAHCESLL